MLAGRESAAQEFRVEDHLPGFVEAMQQQLADHPQLGVITLHSGQIVRWRFDSGKDLRFHASSGTLAQRTAFSTLIQSTLSADPQWKRWLELNGFAVVYDGPPTDAAQLVGVEPTPEELTYISRLLQFAQDQIEVTPTLSGVLLSGAVFASRPGVVGRQFVIEGKLVDDEQRPLLQTLLLDAMAADPYWRCLRHSMGLSLGQLVVRPISPDWSRRYYALGLEKFWDFDYVAADEAFKRALAEAPGDLILSYWRVVTHVAMGQEQRAEMKLRYLLQRNPWGESSAVIARELWRVQGPVRWRLQAIERRVLLTRSP